MVICALVFIVSLMPVLRHNVSHAAGPRQIRIAGGPTSADFAIGMSLEITERIFPDRLKVLHSDHFKYQLHLVGNLLKINGSAYLLSQAQGRGTNDTHEA
jgi:hypothetical protein